ncbi:lipopolysaccharide ABC transporter permease LptG [Mergibacter septicus]|uniref:LPS export ABC transporter permease LptG n=1 Tax=Mergibacter septicus TaxID=221402 RepID=UPI001179056E|nr:LPS export ABC transporter permease LptG [Mergibacter septicus]AWX14367.1 lipopolysaccharide ABC transporter permease LptG [Mergibacter septicus]
MFKVLDRYIGKTIVIAIFFTLLLLAGLSTTIRFVEQFRSIGRGTYDIWQAIAYTLFSIPKDIEIMFPMAALIGALIGLGSLASGSELISMQAAGFSRLRIGLAVMKTSIPLIILMMIAGEWLVPHSEQTAKEIRYKAIRGTSLLSVQNGVWAKDGNNFIYIQKVTDKDKLQNIYVYQFNQKRQLITQLHADSAEYRNKQWWFSQMSQSTINKDHIETNNYFNFPWKTNLTPDKLGIVATEPSTLSITGLANYISFLQETGQDARRFQLNFWRKIFEPLSVGVMMLLALSFIFGPLRSVTMGARIVTGICFGFIFYITNEIFGPLSLVYNLPPLLGALLPSVLFLTITLWLFRHKK